MIVSFFRLPILLLTCPAVVFVQPRTSKEYPPTIPQSPKYEVRAVWITTIKGLDWPRSYDKSEQQRSLREIIAQIREAKFNTIYFQVRGRGDVMYRSGHEPWAQQLTGTFGRDPGWEPLQLVLQEAHAAGIEVHAWFNTFLIKTNAGSSETPPTHPAAQHADWVRRVNDELWLDPGLPQVRAYLVKVALELVRTYDIDGIHFDYIRYPGPTFPDDVAYKRYAVGASRDHWRRENINAFVRAVYDSIKLIKPMLKVGSTPLGIHTNVKNGHGRESYATVFQDSRLWLKERKHDYLAPQVYWSLGNFPGDPDFATITHDWSENSYGRQVVVGIGAYKPEVFGKIPELIDASRRAGVQGNAFFRYEHISQWWRVGDRYAFHAIVPPMPWKDPWPPQAPLDLSAQDLGNGKYRLQWKKSPKASDGDDARRYIVYRSTSQPIDVSDPTNIVAIMSRDDTSFLDLIARPLSARYYYAVTALDKMNNESEPTGERAVVISEIAELAKRLALATGLADPFSRGSARVRYFPYELDQWATVDLRILDSAGTTVKTIIGDIRGPGKYVQAVDVAGLRSGLYLVQLHMGGVTLTKPLRVVSEKSRFSR